MRIRLMATMSRKYMIKKDGILIVSYVKSLRFKLMLLCVIPLVSLAVVFIAHSVFIAFQMRDMASSAYLAAVSEIGAEESIVQALREVSVDTDWIAGQWAVCFGISLVCFYIPITINIKKFIMPIRQMSKYSDSLAEGDVQIEVIKNRTDEIGILQESFQKLACASQQQADLIRRMADGDISGSYTPRSESDVVGHSLVEMLENNNAAMTQVAMAAEQITSASSQIADSSQLLASGATQQSASIAELSDSIKDVAQMTYSNAELVNRATDLGDTIMVHAKNGNRQMEQMVDAVKEISDASLGINKVMKVIDDIAFQTNILALNAAVEAARAGQHGKGFAVVADEVRNLASKSAEAAKDTGSLIANSIEKAQLGTQIASETAASLTEIVAEISESSQIIANVAKSYERQNKAIEQINSGMDQVLQVVHQNSASAEESAAASEEMSAQSKILQGLVSQFKLKATSSAGESNLRFRSHPQNTINTAYSLTSGGEFNKY